MCEPYHSVNQFEDHDPTSHGSKLLAKVRDIGVKIRNWLHFSKAGAGHSEAMAKALDFTFVSNRSGTRYEVAWWDRHVALDGEYRGELDPHDALISCEKYAMLSSIGHIQIFRRWFETTLKSSTYGRAYLESFRNMLTTKGKEEFGKKLQYAGFKAHDLVFGYRSMNHLDPKIVKAMMGMTRKRELLVPEWADDSRLWTPLKQDKNGSLILPGQQGFAMAATV